ncbi:hypothetical protein BDN67DRAFT_963261 [Paxillus ammoniavirescens]|nr:hypothetical protein BDN67DRAFT_963261 [Paxillus ammoniavirescens]
MWRDLLGALRGNKLRDTAASRGKGLGLLSNGRDTKQESFLVTANQEKLSTLTSFDS